MHNSQLTNKTGIDQQIRPFKHRKSCFLKHDIPSLQSFLYVVIDDADSKEKVIIDDANSKEKVKFFTGQLTIAFTWTIETLLAESRLRPMALSSSSILLMLAFAHKGIK